MIDEEWKFHTCEEEVCSCCRRGAFLTRIALTGRTKPQMVQEIYLVVRVCDMRWFA